MRQRIALIALALLTAPAFAQDAYPSRPITMVVAFPPGGVAELTGRPTAIAMERVLKQRIIIENRPGAAGATGNAYVANARPDGYTLLMALSSISVIPEAERLQGNKPPYELNQFAPIALVSADPVVLVVREEAPWKSVQEFISAAKQQPNKITYSSSGIFGALPTMIGQIKGKRLRPLANFGDKRLASLPDVPTLKELGIDAEYFIWSGLMAPAATPPAIQQKLRDAVRQAVQDPDFKTAMAKVETPVAYLDAPEFRKFWDADAN